MENTVRNVAAANVDKESEKIVNQIVKLLDGLPLNKARALLRQAEQRSCENAYVVLSDKLVSEDSNGKFISVNPQKCCY